MLNNIFRKDDSSPLDPLIDAVKDEMHAVGVNSSEYSKLLDQLERLYKIKAEDRRDPVSPDTLIAVAGNLMGILMIVAYEQKHVITSKGINYIKPKQL